MNLKDKLRRLEGPQSGVETGKQQTITDLRRRLERIIDRDRNSAELAPATKAPEETESLDIDRYVPGEFRDTPYGRAFVALSRTDRSAYHGVLPLEALLEADLGCLDLVCSDPALCRLDPSRALFLDTETTGLSGGTGSLAFLIGAGFFEGDAFVVEQYFMRDFEEEPAALHLFAERVAGFDYLVTFNGRAFDVALLDARLTLARMDLVLARMPNLDLLPPSRRLWRDIQENCRLATIEEEQLEIIRNEDIPGSEIPAVYFDYIRERDARKISRVFRHNELDVLSMVTLTARIARMLADHPAEQISAAERLSLGKIYESAGRMEQAAQAFGRSAESAEDKALGRRSLRHQSMVFKRLGQSDRAVDIWNRLVAEKRHFDLQSYEELAKYLEHSARDYGRALALVQEALERIGAGRPDEIAALKHRLDRLVRKSQGSSPKD